MVLQRWRPRLRCPRVRRVAYRSRGRAASCFHKNCHAGNRPDVANLPRWVRGEYLAVFVANQT